MKTTRRNRIWVGAWLALTLGCPPLFSLSIQDPPPDPEPKSHTLKYQSSAARLAKEADRLEKRIPVLPEAQKPVAAQLVTAKRDLAKIKQEGAGLWKQHLGTLPDEFKARLKAAQSAHSSLQKEFYRIGRELKMAKLPATTNAVAPASVFGR